MLTLDQEWLDAFSATPVRPVYVVELTDGSDTYAAASDDVGLGYPMSVASVSATSCSMNVWTRQASIGSVTVSYIGDGYAKDLVVAHRWRGKQVVITHGAEGVDEAKFAPYFAGMIDNVVPYEDGSVDFECVDAFGWLRNSMIVGYWLGQHPLQVLLDIIQKAGVPSSLYTAADFDPAESRYASISHWNVARGEIQSGYLLKDKAIREPESALTLAEEVCSMLNGGLVIGEDGKLRFVLFDTTASVVDTWTEDDIGDDEVSFVELDGNAINAVAVEFFGSGNEGAGYVYRQDDIASQADFAYPGEGGNVFMEKLEADWIDGKCMLGTDMTASVPAVGGKIDIFGEMVLGVCGARAGMPRGTQPASAKASSSRLVYLRIDNEIVAIDEITITADESYTASFFDVYTFPPELESEVTVGPFPYKLRCRVQERGAMGTTRASHAQAESVSVSGNPDDYEWVAGSEVVDCTIPMAMAQARLARFAYGVPVIKLRTNLSKYAVQLTDFVRVETGRGFLYEFDTIEDDLIWEVIGKEVVREDDGVFIEWTLAYATQGVPPTGEYEFGLTPGKTTAAGVGRVLEEMAKNTSKSTFFVTSGLGVTSVSGLIVSVAAGVVVGDGTRIKHRVAQTITLPASKNNYIYFDASGGTVVVKSVATSLTAPSSGPSEVPLARIVTGVAAISGSITDQRPLQGVKGGRVIAASITSTQIKDGAIITAKLASGAVAVGNIATGAVGATQMAAGAVNTEHLANQAVKPVVLASKAVATAAIAAGQKTSTNVINNTLTQWAKRR